MVKKNVAVVSHPRNTSTTTTGTTTGTCTHAPPSHLHHTTLSILWPGKWKRNNNKNNDKREIKPPVTVLKKKTENNTMKPSGSETDNMADQPKYPPFSVRLKFSRGTPKKKIIIITFICVTASHTCPHFLVVVLKGTVACGPDWKATESYKTVHVNESSLLVCCE